MATPVPSKVRVASSPGPTACLTFPDDPPPFRVSTPQPPVQLQSGSSTSTRFLGTPASHCSRGGAFGAAAGAFDDLQGPRQGGPDDLVEGIARELEPRVRQLRDPRLPDVRDAVVAEDHP